MLWGRRGRDREVLGFTTIYAISVYCEFESRLDLLVEETGENHRPTERDWVIFTA
jgi:hypothetical protein